MSIQMHPLRKPVFTAFFGILPLHTPRQDAWPDSENRLKWLLSGPGNAPPSENQVSTAQSANVKNQVLYHRFIYR